MNSAAEWVTQYRNMKVWSSKLEYDVCLTSVGFSDPSSKMLDSIRNYATPTSVHILSS
jgi:hypothetical protein